jgi:hypothetical protein
MQQKVKSFEHSQSLCEIYSVGFQMAFVSEEFEQCHPWVLCKDFLTDSLWATFNTDKVRIYGFEYNPADHPLISLDPVRILVRNKEKSVLEFEREIQNACKFINLVEVRLKFNMASVERVEHSQGNAVWMFTLDKRWVHAPPMISMLSLFVRIGCCYDGKSSLNDAVRAFKNRTVDEPEFDEWGDCDSEYDGENQEVVTNDKEYLSASRSMRLLILKKGISIFQPKMEDNYPGGCDIHTVHNDWGIVEAKRYEPFQTLWDLDGLDTIGKKKKAKKKAAKKKAQKKVLES